MFTKKLYAKAQSGRLFFWEISGEMIHQEFGRININYGQVGGIVSNQIINIREGLANRTVEEQMMLRINARIENKMNSGYLESEEDAMNFKRVNAAGLKKQMLAARFDKLKKPIDYSRGVWVQPKFNGHRCSIVNKGGQLIAYSRNGKLIDTIDHILSEIEIPIGTTLDGELYCHGLSLQQISSRVKKSQDETIDLKFMIYDIFDSDGYEERFRKICNFEFLINARHCCVSETYLVISENKVMEKFAHFVNEGYEGAMIRVGGVGYEDGKRSKSLIKLKKKFDDEFLVVDIVASAEGWGILQCVTKEGKRFSVSAPGTLYQKYEIMDNKTDYIGKYIQIEYYELTDDKKPFHPVALRFREKTAE